MRAFQMSYSKSLREMKRTKKKNKEMAVSEARKELDQRAAKKLVIDGLREQFPFLSLQFLSWALGLYSADRIRAAAEKNLSEYLVKKALMK